MGRGFGERLRTGDGERGSDPGSAADRISEIAGHGLSALKAQTAAAAERAAVEAEAAKEKAAEKVAEEAAKAKSVGDALKAAGAAEKAAVESKVAATVAKVSPSDGNVAQWAKWLADQLHQIPDIQVYDALRLSDLTAKGPAPARAIWATAQAVLGKDYGKVTVADLLKQFHP